MTHRVDSLTVHGGVEGREVVVASLLVWREFVVQAGGIGATSVKSIANVQR